MEPDEARRELQRYLVSTGMDQLKRPRTSVHFTSDPEANAFTNDLESQPHAFVLACLLDRQMPAEKVWAMPYRFAQDLGGFDIARLSRLDEAAWQAQLRRVGHRFPERMSVVLQSGVARIRDSFGSDASRIWNDSPSSARVVRRFLAFHGAGPKIATMAANILVRDFKVTLADLASIDVSADVQVNRVMERLGLVTSRSDTFDVVYAAREIHPEFPGVLDLSLWQIGRDICRPRSPRCGDCPLAAWCPSNQVAVR